MSKTNIVEPKVRFKEFAGENAEAWEQSKAGDIFKTISDKGHLDLPVLSASQELGMIRRDEIGIDIKYDEKSINTYKRVKPGQFVIHLRSFQGGFAWSDIEGITSPAYTVLDFKEPEKQVSKFWKEVLTSTAFIKRLETVTYGIRDGRSISFTDFSSLKFNFPNFEEQSKIGKIFVQLDNLIALHQRELDNTKAMKQTMLSKMFPKDGSDIPEFRFAGFTDPWEQRKFVEVADFNPKSDLPDSFEYVDLESVIGTEMIAHREESKNSAPSRAQRLAQFGDLFYQTVRPYQKNNYLFEKQDKTYVFSTGYAQIRPKNNGYFLLSLVQTEPFVRSVLDRCTGTSYPAINSNDLAKMTISLPCKLEEEIKIGQIFRSLDNLITLHQRELETYQTLKKTMLEKMFI